MKKFNTFKIVQLILLIILTAVSLYMLMQPEVKQYIFDSTPATVLFIIVWAVLLVTFVFLLIDFSLISSMKNELPQSLRCGVLRSTVRHSEPFQL